MKRKRKRKQSRAARAGHTVAYMLLLASAFTMFVLAAAMAVGVIMLPVEKMIAMLIFVMYLTARVGGE